MSEQAAIMQLAKKGSRKASSSEILGQIFGMGASGKDEQNQGEQKFTSVE